MTNYQTAPFLELNDYKAPEGVKSIYIPMKDRIKIRVLFWKSFSKGQNSKGTILLQQGHNEFIEKYYETIQEFLDRGFNVICFDWRGQGLSDKMIKDDRKQYIEDFNYHDDDLLFILDNFISTNFPKPLIGIGHSMGGCIMLSALKKNEKKFDKIILSSPMLGFKNELILLPMIKLFSLLFPKENYMIGSKPNMGKEAPFLNNDLTTDEVRYSRTQELVRKNKRIRMWGITNAWAIAVRNRLLLLRKKNWAEKIEIKVLFINSLGDRVVSSKYITKMYKRIKNAKIVNFNSCEHEIFMEKDKYRKILWKKIDEFIN